MPKPVLIKKKPAKKPGRPTLLNPSRQAALLSAIEEGLPLKEAAEIAGISYDTLNHWTSRGQSESALPEYRQFCQLLRRSQAVAMQVNVSAIREAAKRDGRAAAWILERRFPADFARQQQIEHRGPGGKPLISPYDDCEVLQRMRKQTGLKELAAKPHEGPTTTGSGSKSLGSVGSAHVAITALPAPKTLLERSCLVCVNELGAGRFLRKQCDWIVTSKELIPFVIH